MSILDDIRKFLNGKIKNPVMVAAVAYMIYSVVKKYWNKKESLKEGLGDVRIIQSKPNNEVVIYDTRTRMYIHIKNNEVIETSRDEIKI